MTTQTAFRFPQQVRETALKFIGLFLRSRNHRRSDGERAERSQKLEQFVEECKLIDVINKNKVRLKQAEPVSFADIRHGLSNCHIPSNATAKPGGWKRRTDRERHSYEPKKLQTVGAGV